jgi:hypothetical protein
MAMLTCSLEGGWDTGVGIAPSSHGRIFVVVILALMNVRGERIFEIFTFEIIMHFGNV